MAEIVLRTLAKAGGPSRSIDAVMVNIAAGFAHRTEHPQRGHRAPGNSCVAGFPLLKGRRSLARSRRRNRRRLRLGHGGPGSGPLFAGACRYRRGSQLSFQARAEAGSAKHVGPALPLRRGTEVAVPPSRVGGGAGRRFQGRRDPNVRR